MRLIACPECHTQYDVTHVAAPKVSCRCGVELENREHEPVDVAVFRCSSCSAQVDRDATECTYCGSAVELDDLRYSLVCPECYSRNTEDARFCTACGVTFAPESLEAKGEELPCPCCESLMAVRELVGVAINECGQCNGLWVPEDHLDFLIERAIDARKRAASDTTQAFSPPAPPRTTSGNPFHQRVHYRKCPACSGMMARRNFRKTSGIIIDQCRDHGSWLDADELEALAGFVLSGGRPEADAFMKNLEENDRKVRLDPALARPQHPPTHTPTMYHERKGSSLVGLFFELLTDSLT